VFRHLATTAEVQVGRMLRYTRRAYRNDTTKM